MNALTPERWHRIDALFAEALERPADERTAFLQATCGDDHDLYDAVQALLADEAAAAVLLGESATAFASPFLPDLQTDWATSKSDLDQHIGPYRLVRELGRGGMGVVYLAERADEQFQQTVAVKLIQRGLTQDELLTRFHYERQILASLDHPNIARLYDGGTLADGRPYFIMEYAEGQPITRYCDDHQLTMRQRLALFRTVCRAVQFAHRNLVVHRDLKPSNILVTNEGEVKLLDFGIAKLLAEEATAPVGLRTQTGHRLMTPEYAAPEQIRGTPTTTATDVYQLGVLLYELLTGRRPFRIDSRVRYEIERVILEEEPTRPSTAVGQPVPHDAGATVTPEQVSRARSTNVETLERRLRGDLDVIVLKALRKEAEQRYESVEQLSEDVRRHLVRLPVHARPITWTYRLSTFARRNRVTVLAASITLLSLIVGAGAALWQARAARLERDAARHERDKAEQVVTLFTDLFRAAEPTLALGDTLNVFELLEQGHARLTDDLQSQPGVYAGMLNVIGMVYRSLGALDQATPLIEQALTTREALHAETHPDVAESLNAYASVLQDQGDYERADSLFRRALSLRQQLHFDPHDDIAESLNNLALLATNQGDYALADSLFHDALTMWRTLHGSQHRNVANVLNNIGQLYFNQGDYEVADSLNRQALTLRRALHGDVHPDVGESLNNLALTLKRQGDYEAAEPMYRETLALNRVIYGNNHPFVANVLNNLGVLLTDKGDSKQAETTLQESLSLYQSLYGNTHGDIANVLNNLAVAYTDQEGYQQAAVQYRKALAIIRALPERDDYLAGVVQNNLAGVLSDDGKHQEAVAESRAAVELLRTAIPNHPTLGFITGNLAHRLTFIGEHKEAETLFQEALHILQAQLPAEHRFITDTQSKMGACLTQQGRYEEAEALLLPLYQAQQKTSVATAKTLDRLIALYEAWDKPEEAAKYRDLLAEASS